MFKLIKATATVSLATIATALVGIVRAKFTAVTLGPSGVGIFSQATNFQQLIVTISSLTMQLGVTKYVAKYYAEKDDEHMAQVISCAFLIQAAMSVMIIIFIAAFSGYITHFIFLSGEYRNYLIFISIAAIFSVLGSTYEATMCGFGNYKAFAKGRGLSSMFSLAPLIIFITAFHIKGAFLYLIANCIIIFIVYHYLFEKNVPQKIRKMIVDVKRLIAAKDMLGKFGKDLLSYGGASFICGILSMANIIFLRSLLIKFFGPEANGYYQVVFTLSVYYIALFTNGLWAYLYARISAAKNMKTYSVEINHAIRFCVFGIVLILTTIFFFRTFIINMIFSEKFMAAKDLFAAQLFGDLFFILIYIMGVSFLASARLKAFIFSNVLYSGIFIGFFLISNSFFGIRAITISYAAASIIIALSMLLYHVNTMHLKIYKKNVWLLISAICILSIVFFTGADNVPVYFAKAVCILIWLWAASTLVEKRKAIAYTKGRFQALYAA